MDSLAVLKKLEKEKKLSLIERILAVTSGSVTQILEVYTGAPVKIKTLSQEVKVAGAIAGQLNVAKSDLVNFREVEILDAGGKLLMTAKSWTPLKRLEPAFREDLMKADVPIGKLLLKHKIETKRELLDARVESGRVKRTYNIIRKNEVLMRVEERFGRLGT
jgi:beta-ribofuranosylaminobenzene 5'-phosphate synthase